ncbi:MAG: hypothetical protein ACFE9S_07525 [Candidatus Hermodarchaeota archaeon]
MFNDIYWAPFIVSIITKDCPSALARHCTSFIYSSALSSIVIIITPTG